MAEHGLSGQVLGLSLDGTGYGDDGTVWGGELLLAGLAGYRRLGRLRPFSLPGGEAAVKQPWRVGLALLIEALGAEEAAKLDLELIRAHGDKLPLINKMMERGLNTPAHLQHGGRLFDGVAALCGLRFAAAYEGQAAVELEQAMTGADKPGYGFVLREAGGLLELDWAPALEQLVEDVSAGADAARGERPFPCRAFGRTDRLGAGRGSGQRPGAGVPGRGLFYERRTAGRAAAAFRGRWAGGLLRRPRPPSNDGGLSLGQAVAAANAWGPRPAHRRRYHLDPRGGARREAR